MGAFVGESVGLNDVDVGDAVGCIVGSVVGAGVRCIEGLISVTYP